MGNAAIYYYPDSSTVPTLETIDLGSCLSDLRAVPIRDRADGRSMDGRNSGSVVGASLLDVRVFLEIFTDEDVAMEIETLSAHLERGGYIAVTNDTAKAWAAFIITPPRRGDTVLQTGGNVWQVPAGAVAADDYVVIEGLGNEGFREIAKVSSVSSDEITLDSGLKYTYTDTVVSIRYRDFYPVLWMPAGSLPILTHDRRINWTLDLSVVTDPAVMRLRAESSDTLATGTAGNQRLTLEGLLAVNQNRWALGFYQWGRSSSGPFG